MTAITPNNHSVVFENLKTPPDLETPECSICLEGYTTNPSQPNVYHSYNEIGKHVFHKDCLVQWVNSSGQNTLNSVCCPLCKQEIDLCKGIFQISLNDALISLKSMANPFLKRTAKAFLASFTILNSLFLTEQATSFPTNHSTHPYINLTIGISAIGLCYLGETTGKALADLGSKTLRILSNNRSLYTLSTILDKISKRALPIANVSGMALGCALFPFCNTFINFSEQVLFFYGFTALFIFSSFFSCVVSMMFNSLQI